MTEQTKAPAKSELPKGYVRARVLPQGDGQIFTGEQNGLEFPRHAKGAVIELPESVAQDLEARGFVEIQ